MTVGEENARVEIGPYTIVGRLGQGTLGTTYLALQSGQSRRLAIRILHRHLWEDEAATKLVLDEARSANRMHHPNVVQTLDVGRMANGVPYIVMEYASGPSLDVIAAASRTDPERVRYWCSILTSMLAGIGHAHGVGIVHGAITASEVRVGAEGVPKLLGLEASLLRESLEDTFSPRMERALRYAAPELLRVGGRASTASDVFSIAVCGWEGLAGRPMYRGSSTAELMQHRMQGTVLPLREVAPDVPEGLCEVLEAAMSADPMKRPTVQAFLAAIRPACSGVMPHDVAGWLESLFPVGEDDATRVFGGDRSESATAMGMPRAFGPVSPAGVAALAAWPPFPKASPSMGAAGDPHSDPDPEERTTIPGFTLPLPRPPRAAPVRRRLWPLILTAVAGSMLLAGLGSAVTIGAYVALAANGHASLEDEVRTALATGRTELALDLVTRLDPDRPEAAALIRAAQHQLDLDHARVYLLTGHRAEAEARIRQVLVEDPEHPRARELLALLEAR